MRRRQIQDAAKQEFMLKGFSSATMEDIAERAELSPATIYLYFKNKEELFASLILITLEYLLEETKKVHDDKRLSVEGKILRFKEAMYKTFQYDPLLLRNVLHFQVEDTLLDLSPEILYGINDITRQVMKMYVDVYEEGIRQGTFIKGGSIVRTDIIWGLFTGLVMWEEAKRKISPKKDFLKSTLDEAFDIFLRGIKK